MNRRHLLREQDDFNEEMPMMRVAINGLGRIGRATFKILVNTPQLELVAINDLAPADQLTYLLNHDTVYGRYHIRAPGVRSVLPN
jgi:glyceraldehyde 3-phosphate dehydrogenase